MSSKKQFATLRDKRWGQIEVEVLARRSIFGRDEVQVQPRGGNPRWVVAAKLVSGRRAD